MTVIDETTLAKVRDTEKPVYPVGTRVKVTEVGDDFPHLLGQVCCLVWVDTNDPNLTYKVSHDGTKDAEGNEQRQRTDMETWVRNVVAVVQQTAEEAAAVEIVELPFPAFGSAVHVVSSQMNGVLLGMYGATPLVLQKQRGEFVIVQIAERSDVVEWNGVEHGAIEVPDDTAQLATLLVMQYTALRGQEEDLRQVRERNRALSYEHETFKDEVRTVAIRVASEQSWCTPGLNGVLKELGLPPKETTYDVEVTVRGVTTITIQVEAEDEDEARRKVEDGDHDADLSAETRRADWDVDENADVEVQKVDEA